jgi:small subunit ribosomal protein S4
MARYTGPRVKVCRTLGIQIPGLTNKSTERNFPPGQHGQRRKGKSSDYKVRLVEKQKLRFHFGLMEKQFRRYVTLASKGNGPAGANLLVLLESRLDNVVWRLGLAPTIPAARQLVTHGHIFIGGHRVDRPSYTVKPGQEVTLSEKSKQKPFIQAALEASTARTRPGYLEFDPAQATGKMITSPTPSDLPFQVNTQAVIEYYSQKL